VNGTELKQRLAAILAADVAGYSRLMAADERATVAALDSGRAVFRFQIESSQGRVIDMAGDSVLAVFETATGAVTAALAVQEELKTRAADVPENRRMRFRIGIHLGDVIEKADGTVYGDGVNIAARLEALAEPGGITISDAVQGAVRGKVAASFVDQGEQQVKNIPYPVRAFAARTDGNAAAKPSPAAGEIDLSLPEKPSIAVLPFANMSGDPEQEYFTDGMSEDIITELSRFHSLFVIARNSTFSYKGRSVDVRTVAKELGVRYVLEGSIRRAANRIRVTAQLIDALTGNHIWAEKYDRVLEDIFELQDAITRRIVAIVAPKVEQAEQKRSAAKQATNLAAWEYYQRGMALLERYSQQGNAEARTMFERAIALNASYSLAYVGLALSHNRDLMLELSDNREESAARAFHAAKRAVELDHADSYARCVLAVAHMWPSRYEAAIEEAEHAVELNPSNAFAFAALAHALDAVGRHDDAIERFEKSIQINPRDPRMHIFLTTMARAHVGAGRYDAAAALARKTINMRTDYPASHYILASALGYLGRLDEARAELAECERLQPGYVARRARWQPYRDAAKNEHLHAGVRAAQAKP
jgi:adenylate cyclase